MFYGLLHPNDEEQPVYRNATAVPNPLEQSVLTRRFTGEAVQFIDENAHRPFFLYMAHTAPHIPLAASPEFANSSRAGVYGDVVQELDWSVGALLDALERNGIAENTAVIFTSDNGPFPEGSTGGLRGGKATAWEGGFRVPFMARWPGRVPDGRASGAMAMNIDLLPTLAAMAGIPLPDSRILDGRAILPVLTGAPRTNLRTRCSTSSITTASQACAHRTGRSWCGRITATSSAGCRAGISRFCSTCAPTPRSDTAWLRTALTSGGNWKGT